MIENLQNLDVQVFQWINSGWANPVFDSILPWCREKWFWMPVYWFIAAFSLLNFEKKGWIIILGLILAAGLADFTSSTLIKKNVQRLRPCNDPDRVTQIILRVPCGSGYSFTSSHAANHFAAAIFLIGLFGDFRKWVKPAALLWASSIAFSQVYVGVHYPGDVIMGSLLGSIIGWWVYVIFARWKLSPL